MMYKFSNQYVYHLHMSLIVPCVGLSVYTSRFHLLVVPQRHFRLAVFSLMPRKQTTFINVPAHPHFFFQTKKFFPVTFTRFGSFGRLNEAFEFLREIAYGFAVKYHYILSTYMYIKYVKYSAARLEKK